MIELLWNNPISEVKMNKYLGQLPLSAGQLVLDVGCGSGEVLIRLCEQKAIQATGIDSSAALIAEARRRAADRVLATQIHFLEADARTFRVEPGTLDLAICLGATHAFGLGQDAYRNALEKLLRLLASGGRLLVGEGYMKQAAAPEYRQLLGDAMPDERTHAGNVDTGKKLGLIPLGAWTSSQDEWDDFEWNYQRIVEQRFSENPRATDARTTIAQRRSWIEAYLRWGRDTLGFGIYLFQRP